MKPSRPGVIPVDPAHDAISAWLLRAVKKPGTAERLLERANENMSVHFQRFVGIELEVLLADQRGEVKGFADARLDFTDGISLWVEIKTDDEAIGALVRQVKMYRRLVPTAVNWLAILPQASVGAQEFLAHAGIGAYIVDRYSLPPELFSASAGGNYEPIPETP
jgi:hypothetical protein